MFDLADELFISEAYLLVLGRPADPSGYVRYLHQLKRRLPRLALIAALQSSPEGKARLSAGGDRRHVAADLWPFRAPHAAPGLRAYRVASLIKIIGAAFVEAASEIIFGRPASRQELDEWAGTALTETGRLELLHVWHRLAHSRLPWNPWWVYSFPAHKGTVTTSRPDAEPAAAERPFPGQIIPRAAAGSNGGPMTVGLFTIATRTYLPFVRVLMQSVRRWHPEFQLFVLLVDETAQPTGDTGVTTVRARDLGIHTFDDMSLRYNVVELCTALKPFFFLWLLETTELDSLIYLDPDIRLFAPIVAVTNALGAAASLVLTPHITAPYSDTDVEPSEHTILKSGVFNLGFAAIRRSPDAESFLQWWAARLRTQSLVAVERNLFTDQRWCDMAPALVPNLVVLRDHCLNAAYWNLCQRRIHQNSVGEWLVDSRPLAFFHFSGFDPLQPTRLSKYQNRLAWSDVPSVQQLFLDYALDVLAAGWERALAEPYSYERIEGVLMSETMRGLYATLFPQPLTTVAHGALAMLADRCLADDGAHGLPVIMRHLYGVRSDIARVFDIEDPEGRAQYQRWFWSAGVVEHGLVDFCRKFGRARL